MAAAAGEIAIVRAAAARARCRLVRVGVGLDGHGVGAVDCADGWQAGRFLLALAELDAEGAWARRTALGLRLAAQSDRALAVAVTSFVRSRVAFRRERGEVFTGPEYTARVGFGDCDDHARLVYALLRAAGVPVRLAFLFRPGDLGPRHVVAQALLDGRWTWLETTVAARLGEAPYEAARRLGLLRSRGDIASEVRTMNARDDLPPAPAGFADQTSPAELAEDAAALARLGYLCDEERIDRADDPRLRAAAAAFQRDTRGRLVVDGLVGPRTRAALARALAVGSMGAAFPSDTDTIRSAAATLRAALVELGVTVSDVAVGWLLGLVWGESRFGTSEDWTIPNTLNTPDTNPEAPPGPSHNWGAVRVFSTAPGVAFVWHHDRDRDGVLGTYPFRRYATALEGAKGFLRVLLRDGVGKAQVRAAIEGGTSSRELAAGMYRNGYFTGTTGTDEERIDAYARLIDAGAAKVARVFGAEGAGGGEGGAALAVTLLGAGAALAAWYFSTRA